MGMMEMMSQDAEAVNGSEQGPHDKTAGVEKILQ